MSLPISRLTRFKQCILNKVCVELPLPHVQLTSKAMTRCDSMGSGSPDLEFPAKIIIFSFSTAMGFSSLSTELSHFCTVASAGSKSSSAVNHPQPWMIGWWCKFFLWNTGQIPLSKPRHRRLCLFVLFGSVFVSSGLLIRITLVALLVILFARFARWHSTFTFTLASRKRSKWVRPDFLQGRCAWSHPCLAIQVPCLQLGHVTAAALLSENT